MTYDDVADIKALLEHIVVLLQRSTSTGMRIEEMLCDIADALAPEDPEAPP